MAHKQILFRSAAREKIPRGATQLGSAKRVVIGKDDTTIGGGGARMSSGKGAEGFDAGRKRYVDLIEAGIVDPTTVVRVALENAVSVASVLLLTEATMTEIPEGKSARATEPDMAM